MTSVMTFVNMVLAAILVYTHLRMWKTARSTEWGWIRLATGFIGLIWFFIYGYLLVVDVLSNSHMSEAAFAEFTRTTSRPAVTITLAVLTANVIISLKGHRP